jgi:hypothetical protein
LRGVLVSDLKLSAVRRKRDPKGPCATRSFRFPDEPTISAVEADVTVKARGSEPTVRRKGKAIDVVTIVPILGDLAPALGIPNADAILLSKPCGEAVAARRYLDVVDHIRKRPEPRDY